MKTIDFFVIYDSPRDFPGRFVTRRWSVTKGQKSTAHEATDHATLDEARQAVPQGLKCLPRQPEDEPQVVEAWF